MPFPAILVWGAAAVVAGVGIKKGLDAKEDSEKAKRIGEDAERRYKAAEAELTRSRDKTREVLEDLGQLKVDVFKNQIRYLVEASRKRKRSRSKIYDFDEDIFLKNLEDYSVFVEKSLEAGKGVSSGAIGGALLALGAYGSVGMFATASTGTAIGALSGAAATNATLAWLGGGSLAAGGFGVAGGMVALGGIALAPIIAIGGFWMASKAEEALSEACTYSSKVDKAVAQMEVLEQSLKAIRKAANEQSQVIQRLVLEFERFKDNSMFDDVAFSRISMIGRGLKQLLITPVLQEDGKLNPNLEKECRGCASIVEDGTLLISR